MSERAKYHVKDASSGLPPGKTLYTGPDRRHWHRRTSGDRRLDVRFELSKEDRRCDHGRRHDDEDGYRFLS